jgi:hypothetical protein
LRAKDGSFWLDSHPTVRWHRLLQGVLDVSIDSDSGCSTSHDGIEKHLRRRQGLPQLLSSEIVDFRPVDVQEPEILQFLEIDESRLAYLGVTEREKET